MQKPGAKGLADLKIRVAEMGDAGAIAGLMSELGYETRVAEMEMRLEPILKDSAYQTLVAISQGRLCGVVATVCHLSHEHNDVGARIIALVVSKEMRGRGIGGELVRAAEEGLIAKNITRVALNTRFERKDAHEFYEGLGYVKNGFRFVKTLGGLAD